MRTEDWRTSKAFVKARGASGPDGYEGDELRCLPLEAVEVFAELVHRCMRAQRVPSMLRYAKFILIPKAGKNLEVPN